MAAKKGDDRPKRDPLADEIDALLKKLPHAEPEPSAPSPAPPSRPAPTPSPGRPPKPRPGAGSAGRPPLGVWAQVSAAVLLGAAFTQWPYHTACGWGLVGYGSAITALLIVGGWCVTESWRARLAAAHVVSLVVVFWGIALAAEVVLPRIGYAAEAATWRCVADAPAAVPARAVPAAAPSADQEGQADPGAPLSDSAPEWVTVPDSATVEGGTPPDSTGG